MELIAIGKRVAKKLAALERAISTGDLKGFEKIFPALETDLANAIAALPEARDKYNSLQAWIKSSEYPVALEQKMAEAQLKLEGSFPVYQIHPFKLEVDVEGGSASLTFNRKTDKTPALNPSALTQWVAQKRKKLLETPFHSEKFCDSLLAAYKIANRLMFTEKQERWGKGVSLRRIYELLTIRPQGKKDYPKELFVYDLTRWVETGAICPNGMRFQLDAIKGEPALELAFSDGRRMSVNYLTIYNDSGENGNG